MTATVLHGDCLNVLRALPDCSVDAVVTDPPAGIAFMGKAWDGARGGRDLWVAWLAERLAECLRVLKPGGHAVVWALPRSSGWTHRALEDAGFEVRDCLTHLFGSGFPKSLDVGKAIDKAAGCERVVVGEYVMPADSTAPGYRPSQGLGYGSSVTATVGRPLTAPATEDAQRWDGWGTALKPATEFWYLARKPLSGTVARNVTEWGTGAINIDACRVAFEEGGSLASNPSLRKSVAGGNGGHVIATETERRFYTPLNGRWPANVALTHHPDCGTDCAAGCPVAELDQQSGGASYNPAGAFGRKSTQRQQEGWGLTDTTREVFGYGDSGGASRFFPTFRYQAKPSTREKNLGCDDRNQHPTVKPVELMRWLIRLVTPPGGAVLDPFAGSGTTLVAATLEGFDSIGVEDAAEYLPLIEGRVRWAESQCQPIPLWEVGP